MRVALSAWFWDYPETGSGQYVRALVAALAETAPAVQFVVLLPSASVSEATGFASNIEFSVVPGHRTNLGKLWWEQVMLPRAARRCGADLLHVPYWASPLYAAIPTVVTIHDLIPLLLEPYRGGLLVRLYTAFVRATSSRACRWLP